MIEGLHHVQLAMPAGGEPEAIAFYQGILGIPQVPKPMNLAGRGGCWFETATVKIHLGVEPGFRPARKAHPAFVVSDLAGLRRRLADNDVETADDEPLPGFDRFYAYDPFGNRLEFLSPSISLA
jgi:catechol 2,3-dioxygenase-like lactoylglutathione lyase family enzyme